MGNKRNVTVDQENVDVNATKSEKAYWKREAAARAKEAKKIQAEIDQMYAEAEKADAAEYAPTVDDDSLEVAITRKSAALNRRKRAKKAKKETIRKASAAKARIETDSQKLAAAGKKVPDKAKKGYYSLLKRGAKFADQ